MGYYPIVVWRNTKMTKANCWFLLCACVKQNEIHDHEYFPLQEIRTKKCFLLREDEHGCRNVTKLK